MTTPSPAEPDAAGRSPLPGAAAAPGPPPDRPGTDDARVPEQRAPDRGETLVARAVTALLHGAPHAHGGRGGPSGQGGGADGGRAGEVARSIRAAGRDLARLLVRDMAFSPGYAETTARQIAPKPVLYSAVVAARLGGEQAPTDLEFLAPECTAFLFDQNIDDYNAGHAAAREPNAVREEITRAAAALPGRPRWYHDRLAALLPAPGGVAGAGGPPLPSGSPAYLLLAAGVHRRLAAGLPRRDVADLLYTVGDVLAREHLGMLAHARPAAVFRRAPDLPEAAGGGSGPVTLTGAEAAGLARVESPGLVMVTANQYLRLRPGGGRPVSALLADHPALLPALRTLAAVVSLWDDLGDLDADRRTDSPNVLLGPPVTREAFLRHGGIPDGPVADAVRAGPDGPATRHTADATADAAALADTALASLRSLPADPDLALFLRVLRTIVHGARVNADFNDDLAATMTG